MGNTVQNTAQAALITETGAPEMIPIRLKFESSTDYFVSEAFKVLRTNIQFCGTDVKVISITSCEANEGKTTICLELAKAMSESGKKVLLIDADMRKSVMVTKYADEKGVTGLSQYLSGMAEKGDIIYTAENGGFDIIFAGKFPPNPVELLGSTRFKKLIDEVKPNYDYILIDSPPLGLVIDGAVIASLCDSAVIVISTDMIKYRFALNVKQQLEKSGCHILGVILNHIQKKNSTYYKKYHGYGYYSGYGHTEKNEKSNRKEIGTAK
jgi:capsular exopolysaccharide synthesis family protein